MTAVHCLHKDRDHGILAGQSGDGADENGTSGLLFAAFVSLFFLHQ